MVGQRVMYKAADSTVHTYYRNSISQVSYFVNGDRRQVTFFELKEYCDQYWHTLIAEAKEKGAIITTPPDKNG